MSFTSGAFASASQRVLRDQEESTPQNTKMAYKHVQKEYYAFCESVYGRDPYQGLAPVPEAGNINAVTEEKMFVFLFYVCYREAKPRGRKRKGDDDAPAGAARFNREEFNCVYENANLEVPMDVSKAVSYSTVNIAYSAVKKVWKDQVDQNCNSVTHEQLRSARVIALLNFARTRKATIAKREKKEKINHEVQPYLLAEHLKDIECSLFERNGKNKYAISSLRDRFTFLKTHNGILRGESLFKCELSDMFTLTLKNEGPSPCTILILQVFTGKTNLNKTLYGRVMRHKDVNLCAIGALGLYLHLRFGHSREVDDMDFTDNNSWFDVKVLVDPSGASNKIAVQDTSYARAIKEVIFVLMKKIKKI
jgi:hypothetical protein